MPFTLSAGTCQPSRERVAPDNAYRSLLAQAASTDVVVVAGTVSHLPLQPGPLSPGARWHRFDLVPSTSHPGVGVVVFSRFPIITAEPLCFDRAGVVGRVVVDAGQPIPVVVAQAGRLPYLAVIPYFVALRRSVTADDVVVVAGAGYGSIARVALRGWQVPGDQVGGGQVSRDQASGGRLMPQFFVPSFSRFADGATVSDDASGWSWTTATIEYGSPPQASGPTPGIGAVVRGLAPAWVAATPLRGPLPQATQS